MKPCGKCPGCIKAKQMKWWRGEAANELSVSILAESVGMAPWKVRMQVARDVDIKTIVLSIPYKAADVFSTEIVDYLPSSAVLTTQ